MAKKMIIHAPLSGLTYTFDGNHRTGSRFRLSWKRKSRLGSLEG